MKKPAVLYFGLRGKVALTLENVVQLWASKKICTTNKTGDCRSVSQGCSFFMPAMVRDKPHSKKHFRRLFLSHVRPQTAAVWRKFLSLTIVRSMGGAQKVEGARIQYNTEPPELPDRFPAHPNCLVGSDDLGRSSNRFHENLQPQLS